MDRDNILQTLEAVYNGILQQRLHDSPLLNRQLHVQAVGFHTYREHWVGTVITPWFMNLMLLPAQSNAWDCKQSGEKLRVTFPPGEFEFTIGHEPALGRFATCSLFSPMFQFENQAAAVLAAEAALQALLDEGAMRQTISRRNLLRGAFGSGKSRA